MRRRLNFKLLAPLVAGILVLVVGVHFLHAYQFNRNAGVLFVQAENAKAEGKSNEAINRYMQYLRQRDDPIAYEHLSELLAVAAMDHEAQRAEVSRAYMMMEEALRLHPDLTSVRKRLAELMLTRFGRIGDAMKQYDQLRRGDHDDVQLDVRYAQCQAALGHEESALHVFHEVVGFNEATRKFDVVNPRGVAELDAYVLLADLLNRKFDDSEGADLTMRQMIKSNPKSARAWLLMARYEQRLRNPEAAAKDIARALEIAPNDSDAILTAAELAITQKHFAEAHEVLDRGSKKYPTNEAMFRFRATLALAEQKPDDALKIVEQGIAVAPESKVLWLSLADMQLQRRDFKGAAKSLTKLQTLAVRSDLIEYMQARLLMAEEKWLLACKHLEHCRPLITDLPDIPKQIDLLLGEVYERLGQPDRELDVYHKALMRDPTLIAAKLGEARSLAALGNTEMAIDALTTLQASYARNNTPVPTVVRNQLLQLRFARQLRLPKGKRDWTEVESLAREFVDDPSQSEVQKAIIQADLKFLQEHAQQAEDILMAAKQKHPKDLSIWLSLLNLMQRDYEVDKTQKFIAIARKQLGDIIPLRIAQANLWVKAEGADALPRLATLEKKLDKFPSEQQAAFWSDMGNLYYRLRDYDNTRRCWLNVAKERPEDPRLQQTIFELAVEFSKPDDMHQGAETLRRLSGARSSVYMYAEACEIVWQVRNKTEDRTALPRARRLLGDAKMGRSDWYEVARLGAEIDELDGKTDDAILGYRKALDLSPGHVATARRLVELLYSRGRLAEARDAMQLVGQTTSSDLMEKIGSDILRREGNKEASLAMAEKAVEDKPKDAGNRVWLGQLLDAVGRTADAESQFRKAVALQPEAGMAWLLLSHHLVAAKKPNSALDLLPTIKRSVRAKELPQVLAQYYELVGDRGAAEKIYLDRLRERPKDIGELQSLVSFYLRTNQLPQLHQNLDKLIDLSAADKGDDARERLRWARRVKAQTLKNQGDFDSLQKAVLVIEKNEQNGHFTTEDAVLLANMLGERPEAESRQRAVKLLEKLRAQHHLSDDMQAQLARLYERAGRWDKAREELMNLLGRLGNHPGYMTVLALLQLKHGEVEDAARWIDKVVALQPDAPQTVELRARLLAKQGRGPEAVELIRSTIPKPLPNDQTGRLATAATILESIRQPGPAEAMLRQLVAREPRAEMLLGAFLGRHGDLDEAFELLEKSRRSQSLTTVIATGLTTMRMRRDEIAPRHIATIQAWIEDGLKEEPTASTFRMYQADLHDQLREIDKVIAAYQEVLKMPDVKGQQAAVVKNNLAFVLALRNRPGDIAEANRLIDEAILVLGPSADLQDTRGIVFLVEGKAAEAVREITKSVDEGGTPAKYMHLAFAQEKSGDIGGALRSVNHAKEMGFEVTSLSLLERDRYDALVKHLDIH